VEGKPYNLKLNPGIKIRHVTKGQIKNV